MKSINEHAVFELDGTGGASTSSLHLNTHTYVFAATSISSNQVVRGEAGAGLCWVWPSLLMHLRPHHHAGVNADVHCGRPTVPQEHQGAAPSHPCSHCLSHSSQAVVA